MRRLEILLLCDRPRSIAATLHHHIGALSTLSAHKVSVVGMLGALPPALDLDRFDVVIIHWSLIACHDSYVAPSARARIAAFKGLKAIFIQDEYRFVDKSIAAFRELGIDVLFTCVPESEIEKVYPEAKLPGVVKVNTLTGYVDESLLGQAVPPLAARMLDVGYRARKVPAWLGALGQEKYDIAGKFSADAANWGLGVDISAREEDRIYGDAWYAFMTRCRAVLGVESGASVFDFDGSIEAACLADLAADPGLSFETLRDRHFKDKDGLIKLNQISPRCFEAAALKTLMILYEGEYSGRLTPWRHYVPLKKDHSNMAEVVAVLRDLPRAQAIVETAYREVACNPANSFKGFVAEFDRIIAENAARLGRAPAAGYSSAEFVLASRPSFGTLRRRFQTNVKRLIHWFILGVLLASASEETRTRVLFLLRRVMAAARSAVGRLRRGPGGGPAAG